MYGNEKRRPGQEAAPSTYPDSASVRLRLVEWKPLRKNSLRGFATIELPIGLIISDVPVLVGSNGRPWASLPSKPQLTSDGVARRGEDGRIQYSPILKWRDRSLSERFSDAVVAAVEAEHGPLGA